MTSCQDSPARIWVTTHVHVLQGDDACSKSCKSGKSGYNSGVMAKRNNLKKRSAANQRDRRTVLGKRSPKGSNGSKNGSAANEIKHGYCLAKPTSEKDCNAVGFGYFWNELAGPVDNPVPTCDFETHCVSKESDGVIVERDWVGSLCVIPPKDEGGKSGCDTELDYDWYLATGDTIAACHYKDRCKLEPDVCSTCH
jgi:hypothetical protein